MIKSLSINNYALIQNLEMLPSPYLNIITGETGAGKSIMLGAVGLLLGNRADIKALFTDEEKCIVEGIFDISSYNLQSFFDDHQLDYDDECIIRREISPAGKSRGFINDTPTTLDVMKALGEHLMDIHSQHESLHLGENLYQQKILDLYSSNTPLLVEYQKAFDLFQTEKRAYTKLVTKARESAENTDYKEFLFKELDEADLQEGEQENLEEELELLENAEEIKLNLSQLTQLLDESEFAISSQLKEGLSLLSAVKKYGKHLESLYERLNSASIELKDLADEISNEQEKVEYDPEQIQLVKDRIDLVFRLQQKHNTLTVAELIEIKDNLNNELSEVMSLDDLIAKSKKSLETSEKQVLALGEKLSATRKKHAPDFASAIEGMVHKLGIENGKVEFMISKTEPSPTGIDKVEMLFSANKGVTPQPLKHVASGGEFSRLIFVIKYLVADKTALPTIIFDEIDTGVSGEVALQMISMMKEMSKSHQVISISHLPQFAAGGDAHYFVYKDHSEAKSVSKIRRLENDERVLEIAKMIGGKQPGDHAMQSAKELLSR